MVKLRSMSGQRAPNIEADTKLAQEIKLLLARGEREAAGKRFEALVERHQRRATRIAYYYLRNTSETDEVVQDAFLKTFLHLPSFREELLFELWFTRIVVNTCLDRLKARARRNRWLVPISDSNYAIAEQHQTSTPSPEASLLMRERHARLSAAIAHLPDRQRTVVILNQFEGYSIREVGTMLKLQDATVRVHLFRAIRTLRKRLRRERWLIDNRTLCKAKTRQG